MDDIDLQIISALQKDGRVSLVDLSKEVGLTHPSVRERLLRLMSDELIKVQALVNAKALKLKFAFLCVEASNMSQALQVINKAKKCSRVILAGVGSGDFNAFILLVGDNFDILKAVTEKHIRSMPEVKRMSVSFGDVISPRHVTAPLKLDKSGCAQECSLCDLYKTEICPGCSECLVST